MMETSWLRRVGTGWTPVLCLLASSTVVLAQYQNYRGVPLDNGQQYWQDHWQWHNQQYASQPRSSTTPPTGPQSATPAASGTPYQDLHSYYRQPTRTEAPFSNVRPAPSAYDLYWPLMLSPGWNYGYF